MPIATTLSSVRSDARSLAVCLKHRLVERWVLRRLGAVDHERRVTEISTRLFDLTRPLHGLSASDLKLLRLGAVVHDVGRSICDETHPRDGADLLRRDITLPLSETERRHLAYLTLHHKGAVPLAGRDKVLARTDDHQRLRRILALLRAADALDSRSLESPRLLFAMANGRTPVLRVTCYLENDSPKARKVYTRRKKFRLLEEEIGCRAEINIAWANALAMVA